MYKRQDQDTAFIIHAVFQGSLPGDDGALGGNSRFKLAVDGKIRAELAGLAGQMCIRDSSWGDGGILIKPHSFHEPAY